ncbi:hypothetical protein [Streptomyces sp. SAI-229]|jgi:hypothetical protein|uniref:hypothetical protein n=1 Tax=Streptomyces sp. SAI-229 TaxID=3377731 RepID=UPI003C7E5CE5
MSAQLRAGHIPADLIPPGADPRTVVVVHHRTEARDWTGPILLALVVSAGAAGVVLTLCLLLQLTAATAAAVAAAAPAGVGLSIPLARRKGK